MKNKLFIAGGVVAAFASFVLALQLAPWFYAINVRVRLYMNVPAEANINICWDEQRLECLPLVPYLSAEHRAAQVGEVADIWLSELPPRPAYFLSLQFDPNLDISEFHVLELDSSNIFLQGYGRGDGAGINNLQLTWNDFDNNGNVDNVRSLIHKEVVKPGPANHLENGSTVFFVWILFFSIYFWVAIPIYLLPNAIKNINSKSDFKQTTQYSWKIYVACIFIGIIMVLFVVSSGVLINPYDPLSYIILATGGGWFNISRLPGYPLFLGWVLPTFNYSLDGVILIQAILLACSVLIGVWVLRKWIFPSIAIAFVVLALFSPAQIYFARFILRESLFSSLVVLGITAVVAHFASDRPASHVWLILFTFICGAAFLVRENGIVLPFALAPALLIMTIKRVLSPGTFAVRMRSALKPLILYLPPFIMVGMIYVFFGLYNYLNYGYFQLEEQQTSHGFLSKAMSPSNFDARGLRKPLSAKMNKEAEEYLGFQLYSSYIVSRDQHPLSDQTYAAFYPAIYEQMSQKNTSYSPFYSALILNEIGKNVYSLIPIRAVISGFIRQYIRVLNPDNQLDNHVYRFEKIKSLNEVSFLTTLSVPITMDFEEKYPGVDTFLENYYKFTEKYDWYELYFMFALLLSIYILKYEDVVFLTPMAVYIFNCVLVLYSRMVAARVFVHIDVLLALQIAFGLSLWLARRARNKQQHLASISASVDDSELKGDIKNDGRFH